MLQKKDIATGKYYVNNERRIIREVLRLNSHNIIFKAYHLDTGFSCGFPSECTIQDFARWADRVASFTELASAQYQELEDRFHAPQPFN